MGSKEEKNKFEGANEKEISKFLKQTLRNIKDAKTRDHLESMKVDLIKLYKPIKDNPEYSRFNEPRVNLLKLVNLNLQFLNRVQDAKKKAAFQNFKDAHESIIETSKAINTHPDRFKIHDWVKNEVRETLSEIAEMTMEYEERKKKEEERRIRKKEAVEGKLETIRQHIDDQNIPFKPKSKNVKVKIGQTFAPFPSEQKTEENEDLQTTAPFNNVNTINPFKKNSNKNSKLKSVKDETIRPSDIFQKLQLEQGEEFGEKTIAPFKEQESIPKSPFSNDSPTIRPDSNLKKNESNPFEKTDDEDSIKTFWKKKTDKKKE